jgi:hypothetical protein
LFYFPAKSRRELSFFPPFSPLLHDMAAEHDGVPMRLTLCDVTAIRKSAAADEI